MRPAEWALAVDLPWSESRERRGVLVQLDIPTHGMDSLGAEHFRPVDRALGSVALLADSWLSQRTDRRLCADRKEE